MKTQIKLLLVCLLSISAASANDYELLRDLLDSEGVSLPANCTHSAYMTGENSRKFRFSKPQSENVLIEISSKGKYDFKDLGDGVTQLRYSHKFKSQGFISSSNVRNTVEVIYTEDGEILEIEVMADYFPSIPFFGHTTINCK